MLTINSLLGSALFISDNAGTWAPEQKCELEEAFGLRGSLIADVSELEDDVYRIDFWQNGARYAAFCNLNASKRDVRIQNDLLELRTFEHIILKAE